MSQSDLVYAYETNFIAALETIIDLPATQTRLFGDTATKQTPRIDVGFSYGGVDNTDRALTSDGALYLRKHHGTISLTVNGAVKADHLELVGKVRNFMAWNIPTLINPVLAFYQVQSVFEQGGSNESGEEDGDFEISTELNFDVVFHIPPVAFDTNFATTGVAASNGTFSSASAIAPNGTLINIFTTTRAAAGETIGVQTPDGTATQTLDNEFETHQLVDGATYQGFPVIFGLYAGGFEITNADWVNTKIFNATTGDLIVEYKNGEQSSGSLDDVTTVDSSGNGFDGLYSGCVGGKTTEL